MYIPPSLYAFVCQWITLAFVNNAARNVVYKYPFEPLLPVLGGIYLRVELLVNMVFLCLIILGITVLFSIVTIPFYVPKKQYIRVPRNDMFLDSIWELIK